jgi:predicted amidohydrolase YtcJ
MILKTKGNTLILAAGAGNAFPRAKGLFGWLFLSLTFTVTATGGAIAQTADTVYYNGRIVTMWDAHPVAQAFSIRGNRFLKVGSNDEVMRTAGPYTRRVNLHGNCVTPGLIDSHTHPIMAALPEKDGPVPFVHSITDIEAYIRSQAAGSSPERIIFVPKVYATRLKEHRYPTRYDLDQAAGNRLAVADNGYAAVLDSALLARMAITRDTPQPADGKIIKDDRGEPTGLILGAPGLLESLRRPAPHTFDDTLRALKLMQAHYNQVGLTSVIDRSQDAEGFRAYEELHERGELTVRSYVTWVVSLQGTPQEVRERIEAIPLVTGWGDDWVRAGSLKAFLDGGILTGTAYLREPYGQNTAIYGYVDPEYRGVLAAPRENIVEMARVADELGWQMTAHVTGGGALDALLDAYEAADKEKSIRDRRFTVTHGNFPSPEAMARARKLGVVFDCQPAWHYLDGPAIKDVFGPARMKYFQPYRSLFDAGVVVAGGSDHMLGLDPRQAINPYHPFFGMWMAITRRTVDGTVMEPEQRISREEALRMWTLNAAYLSFEEKIKGSIEPGKLADFVVISRDFLSCPVDTIKDIEALRTVVDGKIVYEAPSRW